MFNLKKLHTVSQERLPFLYLAAAGLMEFLFITLEGSFSLLPYYLAETWIIVPCLLFLGYALRGDLTAFAKRRLLLAAAAVAWFFVVQAIHRLSGMHNHPMGTVLFVYLMAFPFAALSDDRENLGLRLIGGMFVTASLVLVLYTVMLLLNLVPESLQAYLFWDGARLHIFWHPNIAASYFMIGIGFSLVFCAQAKKTSVKVLLAVAAMLQLAAMALTNCRTALLLTGAMLGGFLFFLIFKGGWKRFVLGLLAAGLMLAGTFKISGMFFRWNNDRLINDLQAQEMVMETVKAVPAKRSSLERNGVRIVFLSNDTVTGEAAQAQPEQNGILQGDNLQGSLQNDMRTLNGRTEIWKAALKALRDNKKLALFGTEYSGTVISAYNRFPVFHAHNSWMEALLRMGIPGLLLSLAFTVLSVCRAAKIALRRDTELWKKTVAMLTMCVMASAILEPYLFITNVYYHVTDFAFFFLTGYLDYWCRPQQGISNS